jgi:hypothetical protein
MCLTDLIAASDPPPTALTGAATPVAPGRSSPVERDHPHARASVTSGRSWAWAGFPARIAIPDAATDTGWRRPGR